MVGRRIRSTYDMLSLTDVGQRKSTRVGWRRKGPESSGMQRTQLATKILVNAR